MQKLMFNPKMAAIRESVCEKRVQIGMKMIALLAEGMDIGWPWNDVLDQFRLDKLGDRQIEMEIEDFGEDHKIVAIVAHIDPKTYQVLSIEYTKDFEKLWKKRVPEKSLPFTIIRASKIVDRLTPASPNPHSPYMPELKDLSIDLFLLLGHQRDSAELWIKEDSKGEILYAEYGLEAILDTLYTTFTALGEDSELRESKFRQFRKEPPLDQFRSDLRAFINDLNYVHRKLTIDDYMKGEDELWTTGLDSRDEL